MSITFQYILGGKSLSDSDAKSKDKKEMEARWSLGAESLVNM